MTIKEDSIAIILPALNEEAAIGVTINEIREVLPNSKIIVIDNGSTDGTRIAASKLGTTVLFEPRKGKGYAVKRALLSLDKEVEYILIVDADDTYEIGPIKQALNQMNFNGLDLIVGTRKIASDSTSNRKKTFRQGHQFGNKFLSRIFQLLFGITIEDTLSGWRLFTRRFADTFVSSQTGFELEAELNAHAYVLQCAVGNIDVQYRGRRMNSNSKLSTYRDGIRILRATLKMFRNERPSLAFNLLSLPWILIGFALSARSFIEFAQTGKVLHFPSLITGMTSCVIGSLLWVSGMILERTKLLKHDLFQIHFKANR